MINSALMFVGAVIVAAAILVLAVFGTIGKAIDYLKTPDGKKVAAGIVGFILFGVVLTLLSQCANAEEDKGEWFAYGEVYLGADYTKNLSPMCHAGGPDDRLTSNGGIRANVYQSADERFELNAKYTHHSCAFSPDRESYDAVGFELTYRLW